MATEPVSASVFVEAPPERVYEYFTQPHAMMRWIGEYALLEPRPDGRFHVNVRGTAVRGRYLELDPPHRLVVSWGHAGSDELPPGASTVEVRLTDEGTGTRVELTHRDLPDQLTGGYGGGWTHYLARLERAAVDGHSGPDPGMPYV
jgi:uncharacterized protein YndB with AHSA1/START domain